MPDDDFFFRYLFARQFAKPWKPGPRKHPKMPSGPWRAAALACLSIGALVAWLLFRNGDSGALLLRVIVGALVVFVIGMYIVETIWERREQRRQNAPPPSPIGPRR